MFYSCTVEFLRALIERLRNWPATMAEWGWERGDEGERKAFACRVKLADGTVNELFELTPNDGCCGFTKEVLGAELFDTVRTNYKKFADDRLGLSPEETAERMTVALDPLLKAGVEAVADAIPRYLTSPYTVDEIRCLITFVLNGGMH
jgi:hypothetical protein